MLQQVISVSLLSAMAALSPASSQGIRANQSISGNVYVAPATPVLVATPYPSNPADSTLAVSIGGALRDRLTNKIGGSDWRVVTRREMNNSFQTWGYSPDQLFQPELAKQVAVNMSARVFVMTTMTKNSAGVFTASVRVTGITDDAGEMMRVVQLPNEKPTDFGNRIADRVAIVFKAYPDAKACSDNLTVNKAKAVESANRAIKVIPDYGFAEYCLGLIEQSKDSVGAETVRHFKAATVGDSLSLLAVNQLSIIYQKKHDSTSVIEAYQRMLTIAPTNQKLAQEAIKVFAQYGRPDAAQQVVAEQLKLDPTNADWWDLKGNSCAAKAANDTNAVTAKPQYRCAYEAFSKEDSLDPSRADTNFYPKVVFVAGTRADSMTWAKKWAAQYSSMEDPYTLELQLYMDAGQTDSALTVVRALNAINPANPKPALAVDMALLKAKRYDDVIKLGAFFQKYADSTAKNQYAGLLVTYADSESRATPKDDSLLVKLGKALVAFNAPNKVYTDYGYYFNVLGLSNGFTALSKSAREDKSCDTVKTYEALVGVIDPLVQTLAASSTANLAAYGKQLTDIITSEKAFFPQLEKAYCKPATKP